MGTRMDPILRCLLPAALLVLGGCASSTAGPSRSSATAAASTPTATPLPANGDPSPPIMPLATDSTYAYTREDPVKVGGAKAREGAENERAFLRALSGPNGERVSFERQGSCCQFKTPNAMFMDIGMLDAYEVTYDGLAKPIILYINMYDYEAPRIPVGFKRAR